ncbi:substrate-binding domain-containing protein [Actinotalea sp. K2]|nr:substrate-binding domain-containing protein [Actinotalea sp. K2]
MINDSPKVRDETRLRVLAAIEQLGFRPNGAARALASGRTQVLGVLSLGTSAYETPSTLEGIESAAASAGYTVTFAGTRAPQLAAMRKAVHALVDQRVDGVILIAPLISIDVDALPLPPSLPVVAVEGAPGSRVSAVVIDQVGGSRAATKHLLGLGHRNVWHIAGPQGWFDSRGREEGWRSALAEAEIEPPPLLVGDWGHTSGYEAGRILSGLAEATAVFVANDDMALGLLRALHEGGRRVPEDVSVVGFDDLPEAAYMQPPLTTVRQEFFEVGQQSIRLLLDQIDGRTSAETRPVVPTRLVLRQSTAPPF